jgi:hypothetical protein
MHASEEAVLGGESGSSGPRTRERSQVRPGCQSGTGLRYLTQAIPPVTPRALEFFLPIIPAPAKTLGAGVGTTLGDRAAACAVPMRGKSHSRHAVMPTRYHIAGRSARPKVGVGVAGVEFGCKTGSRHYVAVRTFPGIARERTAQIRGRGIAAGTE